MPMNSGDLEKRLAKLESVIKVGVDGGVTIECTGKVRIKSASSVEIDCSVGVLVKGGATVDVQAGAKLSLKSMGQTDVQGSILRLNNGSRPLARVGDIVNNPASAPGTIGAGSVTILG